jgi:endonuclease VIII
VPEGDTVFKLASALRPDLVGQTLLAVRLPGGDDAERLTGRTVASVEAHGKHLLIATTDGAVLRTHMHMNGTWHRYRPGERWRAPASSARAVLETAERVLVALDMPEVELLRADQLASHPQLSALGPDLARPDPDLSAVIARARSWLAEQRDVADLLLDQRIAAGIGNVFKSEILFVERVDPWASMDALEDSVLRRLFATRAQQIRRNLNTPRRVTAPRAEDVGGPKRGAGLWVYGRDRLPCRVCGTLIRVRKQGRHARGTWWCPECQVG